MENDFEKVPNTESLEGRLFDKVKDKRNTIFLPSHLRNKNHPIKTDYVCRNSNEPERLFLMSETDIDTILDIADEGTEKGFIPPVLPDGVEDVSE